MDGKRTRSFWGWGWEDKFPDAAGRKAIGEHAKLLVGFSPERCDEPPTLESISLRRARLGVPSILSAFVTDQHEARVRHTYGKNYRDVMRGFRGDFSNAPDLVATPGSEDEITAVLDWASDARVAVIPYGGGTSVVGGVEGDVGDAYRGVLSLDLGRLDRVLEVERSSLSARIQAGALGPVLESQLAELGLTLRHFPQSFEFSTLGGWIATRAGGHFASLYTHIDDLVQATRMLTPRGLFESRRLPGSGAGPSPDRLVLGSEGTFGVITEAWMRVRPRPTFRATATAYFKEYETAVGAVRAVSQSGLYPSNCRLLDKREAALNGVTADGSHVLIVAFESADHSMRPSMTRALELVADHG
ncbi:MAG: FAD-binding oxidoreductase, partial [Myxococcales bacterium]|nr:FAD-binding oxidoreductase [Myxococcales bacterium]